MIESWKYSAHTNVEQIEEFKTRTIYLKMTRCSFSLLFALVYKDLNYIQAIFFNISLYRLKKSYECGLDPSKSIGNRGPE